MTTEASVRKASVQLYKATMPSVHIAHVITTVKVVTMVVVISNVAVISNAVAITTTVAVVIRNVTTTVIAHVITITVKVVIIIQAISHARAVRSEEHTSELQSPDHLV